MTPWMRSAHRWLALVIGLQVLAWMSSGVVMSLLDAKEVKGQTWRVAPPAKRLWPADTLSVSDVLTRAGAGVRAVGTAWLLDDPVYRLTREKETVLVDARSGLPRALDAALAARIARASYRGPGQPSEARLVPPSLETRSHPGAVWRVDFDDASDTTVYLSREGAVLEHRNSSWRLFDFFWMLHIMDYTERKDFNSLWLIGIAIGAFWLALSGIWLLFTSFRRAEFVPRRWRGTRPLNVFSPQGRKVHALTATRGDTVFQALALAGMPLPSNCGGGQSGALGRGRVRGSTPPPPTAADRAQLATLKVRDGHRLACNLSVDDALDIEVRDAGESTRVHRARVASVRAVAPFMREVVLAPEDDVARRMWPGCFVQLRIPPHKMHAAQVATPPEYRSEWSALRLPETWSSKRALQRAYSMSLPTARTKGDITLLVRFMPDDRAGAAPGIGSSYVHALRPGDSVELSGPHGDFRLQRGHREKVFIGGGAGMSPLRAMIHALLDGGARERIRFWYGARTPRDAPYLAEMQELAARHANFSFQLVISEAEAEARKTPFDTGWVHEAAAAALRASPAAQRSQIEFYVCGPPAMLTATRAMLAELGISDAMVAFDDFKI